MFEFEYAGPSRKDRQKMTPPTSPKCKDEERQKREMTAMKKALQLKKGPFEKPKSPTATAEKMNAAGPNALARVPRHREAVKAIMQKKELSRVKRQRTAYWKWSDANPGATKRQKDRKIIELDIFFVGIGDRNDYIKDDKKPAAVKHSAEVQLYNIKFKF